MKIGIYLGYAPQKNMSLKQEGLGRYLAYIVKGLIESGNEVVIACPSWVIPAIQELCEEHDIDERSFDILTSKRNPIVFKIMWKHMNEKKIKKTSKHKMKYAAVSMLEHLMELFLGTTNTILFLLMCMVLVVLGVVMLPILAVLSVVYLILRGFGKILHLEKLSQMLRPKTFIKSVYAHAKILQHFYNKYYINREFIDHVRERATTAIISKIASMKTKADIWYCPMAFWSEFNTIPGKRVICAPDIVTSNFAVNFSTPIYGDASIQTEQVRKTLLDADNFITYCEFIKKDLLIDQLNKKSENIVAIPHAINDMAPTICIDHNYDKRILGEETELAHAKKILGTITSHALCREGDEYFAKGARGFSFENIDYIFYASQVRGNKNFLTLIKAYEYLLRERRIPIKLFLTGNIKNDPQIYNYIREHRLQYDVISFIRVSNQQLGALYKCAKLIVNPTLYEGGFNFTFGEGMSVGTPSIMGNIPQVLEGISGYGLEKYFYDPYDYLDMAYKIEYGLKHVDEIYNAELDLFNKMNSRTWSDVGLEYVQAFKYFIEKDKGDEAYV